jgi:hypothetical protein
VVSSSFLLVRAFWIGTAERAAKSFCQALAVSLGFFTSVFDVPWQASLGGAGLYALASILTSIGSGASGVGPTGSPSLVDDQPSRQEMAEAQRLEREDRAGRHRDDGIDIALDNPKEPS